MNKKITVGELVINNTSLIISDDKYRCTNFLYFLRFNYLDKSCENDEYINSIVLLIEKSDANDKNYLMNVIVNYMV